MVDRPELSLNQVAWALYSSIELWRDNHLNIYPGSWVGFTTYIQLCPPVTILGVIPELLIIKIVWVCQHKL